MPCYRFHTFKKRSSWTNSASNEGPVLLARDYARRRPHARGPRRCCAQCATLTLSVLAPHGLCQVMARSVDSGSDNLNDRAGPRLTEWADSPESALRLAAAIGPRPGMPLPPRGYWLIDLFQPTGSKLTRSRTVRSARAGARCQCTPGRRLISRALAARASAVARPTRPGSRPRSWYLDYRAALSGP